MNQLAWRSWGARGRFFAVDLFAGGGGASEGVRDATGIPPGLAVDHDQASIDMHIANHPETEHRCASVFDVDPVDACRGRTPDLLWASPDCTHFSRAKGGRPRSQGIRSLAWVVVDWARDVSPRVIILENVPEFRTWGPLATDGRPDKARAGETFAAFVEQLEGLGYHVEWRDLVAADYGAPTTRKRLFLVARRDGAPISWPEPTHGPGRASPYRTAAGCIDWSIPAPSIFARKRPLAEATQRRIADGIRRYLLNDPEPFVVDTVAHSFIETRNGERKGHTPRTFSPRRPWRTVTAQGSQGALVSAFLARHFTGVVGRDLREPVPTVTAKDHHGLVAAHLTVYYGAERDGQSLREPMRTVLARDRFALVTAFLERHLGEVTTDSGATVVDIEGVAYAVADIGMRMLQPRELATAQGFAADYILFGTKTSQTARIGNSVSPPVARALVAAQFPELARVATMGVA